MSERKILIIGGGFAGVQTALSLARLNPTHTKIILLSDKPHFEYHAALYRIVTGHSALQVCVPLDEIFGSYKVKIEIETVTQVDLKKQAITAGSGRKFGYDSLVLALGSESYFFNIPGIEKSSFGLKSIAEAIQLKEHVHEQLSRCQLGTPDEKKCAAHFMLVGGGASGVELAGELKKYIISIAEEHGINPELVSVDVVEAAPRLLPFLPVEISKKVKQRLHYLGVKVFVNRTVVKQEIEEVFLKGMEMKTQTVIWTAGTKINHLYQHINGLEFDKKGRVIVDAQLKATPFQNVFVIGDAAATPYVGLATTALDQGKCVAEILASHSKNGSVPSYTPRKHWYAIPVGQGWAITGNGKIYFSGRLGWWIRRIIDLKFFLSILPPKKAWLAFSSNKKLVESCIVCTGKN